MKKTDFVSLTESNAQNQDHRNRVALPRKKSLVKFVAKTNAENATKVLSSIGAATISDGAADG